MIPRRSERGKQRNCLPAYNALYITSSDTDPPIEFSASFVTLLREMQERDPGMAGRVLAQIEAELPFWEPGLENRDTIRHVKAISDDCKYRIYRLKERRSVLRTFFFELNKTKPRRRFVATMVERGTDRETYNDTQQPHCKLIREYVLQAERDGRLSRRR